MRTFSIWLLLISAASAQFLEPLDDAQTFYQARDYGEESEIANDGTLLDTPLQLGPNSSGKPAFVEDATIGNHLKFAAADNDHAVAPIPVQFLNGSVTFAILHRPVDAWTIRFLTAIVDTNPELKHFYLHIGSDNKYMARFWGNGAAHPQIVAQGTVSTSVNRTDTVVVTWDADAKQIKLYVNGVNEATTAHTTPRSDAAQPKLKIPTDNATLAAKVMKLASWNRCLSPEEVALLTDNPDWLANAGPLGPPPPPPGVLRVKVNGFELAPLTAVKIDGVSVQPPTTGEKLIEIQEPN